MLCAYDITMGGLYEDVSSNTTMYDESTVVLGILCYAYMGDSYYQDMTDELNEYLELLNCDYKIAIKGISITAWEDSGLSFAEYCEKYYSDVDILQVVSFSENNNVTYDILEEDIYLKLDDYLETEQGKELYLTIPENKWAEVKVNGNIYSVPNTYFDDSGVYFAFNPDYIDAKDLEKFDGTLAGIKDILNNTNVQGLDDTVLLYSGTDILNIYGGHLRYGLYFDDITGEISIWSSSSKIKKVFEELNELYDLGYISNSATMSSTIFSDDGDYPTILEDALKSGEYAVCIGYGRDISDYLENAIIYRCDSYTYNKLGYSMGIYSRTDNESAACDFLNKMYCDETLVNLLNYGAAYSIDTKTFSGDTSNLERDSMINGLNFGNWLFAQDSNSDDKDYRRKFYDELSGSIKNGKFLGFEIDTTGYKSIIDTLNDSCLDNIDLWKSRNFEEEWEKISKENESEEAYASDLAAATDDTEKNAIIIYYEKKLRGENAAYLLQSHSEHLEEISDGGFFYSRGYEKLTGGDIAGSDDQSHAVRLVIILLLLLFGVYSLDYSNNVMGLVKSTIKGRKPFNVSKYLIGLILVTITYFEIYGLWFYKIFHTYGVYGSSFSVCSMEHISEKFAQMTVLQYLIMISIIRYLGCIIIMLVMFWLQRKMKNPMAALIICIFVFLMPLLLYSSGISIMKYVGITPFLLGNL